MEGGDIHLRVDCVSNIHAFGHWSIFVYFFMHLSRELRSAAALEVVAHRGTGVSGLHRHSDRNTAPVWVSAQFSQKASAQVQRKVA